MSVLTVGVTITDLKYTLLRTFFSLHPGSWLDLILYTIYLLCPQFAVGKVLSGAGLEVIITA